MCVNIVSKLDVVARPNSRTQGVQQAEGQSPVEEQPEKRKALENKQKLKQQENIKSDRENTIGVNARNRNKSLK